MKVGLRAQSALQYRPFYARRLVGVSIALLSHCVPSGVGHSVSPSLFALLLRYDSLGGAGFQVSSSPLIRSSPPRLLSSHPIPSHPLLTSSPRLLSSSRRR